jgi:spore coat protein SA
VEVIPYGVDIDMFSPSIDGDVIREKYHIGRSEKVVVFVGRLIKDMGLHTVLESIPKVLQQNRNVTFFIIGEKGDLLQSAIKLAQMHTNKVLVFPSVPFDELPLYYAASTIVIAPTQGERACGSLAAIEAMAVGKPVIAAKVGGIPEIVIDKENGLLIPPEDPVALQEAVLYLLNDEVLLRNMGAASRKRVETYFDERKTDQKIENIFNKLIGV